MCLVAEHHMCMCIVSSTCTLCILFMCVYIHNIIMYMHMCSVYLLPFVYLGNVPYRQGRSHLDITLLIYTSHYRVDNDIIRARQCVSKFACIS